MLSIYKGRLIKLVLVFLVIYFGLLMFNKINNTNENQLIEKTMFLTILISIINFIYPTL